MCCATVCVQPDIRLEVTTCVLTNVVGSKISKDLYFFDNIPFTD